MKVDYTMQGEKKAIDLEGEMSGSYCPLEIPVYEVHYL